MDDEGPVRGRDPGHRNRRRGAAARGRLRARASRCVEAVSIRAGRRQIRTDSSVSAAPGLRARDGCRKRRSPEVSAAPLRRAARSRWASRQLPRMTRQPPWRAGAIDEGDPCDDARRAQELRIADLLANPHVESAAHLDAARVRQYVEDCEQTEPVVVFQTEDGLLLVDGHHRMAAARSPGARTVTADLRDGSREDALRYAVERATVER